MKSTARASGARTSAAGESIEREPADAQPAAHDSSDQQSTARQSIPRTSTRETAPVPFDLSRYEAVAFDLDGTLWEGREPIPGALEFVEHCRARGVMICFATNISVASQSQVRAALLELGFAREGDLVVTSATTVAAAASAAGVGEVAFIGGPGLAAALTDTAIGVHPIDSIDVGEWMQPRPGRGVVMGGWAAAPIGHVELAGRLAAAGIPLFVPSLDAGYPSSGGGWSPGGGMMIAAAQSLHRFDPVVCGKPSAAYAAAVRAHVGDRRLLMIGDAPYSDIGLAAVMGADSVLLTNGRTPRMSDFEPSYTVDRLADLLH